jgi:hypothetical protein
MKRETKYIETERNLPKRNETKWNVHKNWKGMQFSETNIPKRIVVHRPLETSTNQSDVIKRSDDRFLYLVVDSDS